MTQFVRKQPKPEVVEAYQNVMPLTIEHHGVKVPPFHWIVLREEGSVSVYDDTIFRSLWETIQISRLPRATLL